MAKLEADPAVDDGLGASAIAAVAAEIARASGGARVDADALAADLVAAFRRGQDAWPTAQLSPPTFAAAVMARAPKPPGDARAHVATMRLEELYLAAACSAGDPGAILAFEGAFFGEVERTFSPRSYGESFLEDARQNLRERLFVGFGGRPADIANYAGRGSLRHWFGIALRHHTLNLKRYEARAPTPNDPDFDQSLLVPGDPELLYLRQRYASDFRAAIEEAVRQLPAEERAALQHHYVERLSIDRIAAIYGIHRVTAARRVNRARDELVLLVRRALTSRLRVEEAELMSIMRLLPTQFSMSFRRVLASMPVANEGTGE
jgi:RNA polymerase sigma-70 factor (ECF subfamily)